MYASVGYGADGFPAAEDGAALQIRRKLEVTCWLPGTDSQFSEMYLQPEGAEQLGLEPWNLRVAESLVELSDCLS